nr:uncharacterized protein LOC109176865 isoform X2 [Ipomoea batatas]
MPKPCAIFPPTCLSSKHFKQVRQPEDNAYVPRGGTDKGIGLVRLPLVLPGYYTRLLVLGQNPQIYGTITLINCESNWFANDFEIEITTAELLSVASQVVDMVRQYLNQAHEDPNFSRIAEVTKLLFGLIEDEQKGAYSTTADDPQTSVPTPTQHEEAFLAQPEEHIGLGAR